MLVNGMKKCKREFAQSGDCAILRDFLLANEDKVKKMEVDMKKAMVRSFGLGELCHCALVVCSAFSENDQTPLELVEEKNLH